MAVVAAKQTGRIAHDSPCRQEHIAIHQHVSRSSVPHQFVSWILFLRLQQTPAQGTGLTGPFLVLFLLILQGDLTCCACTALSCGKIYEHLLNGGTKIYQVRGLGR